MPLREISIARVSDIAEGDMKAFEVEGHRILLTRIGGELRAFGATCPHYGAPLEEGFLSGFRIVCPWHHAAYDAYTGDVQEPPSLDSLPVYHFKIIGDEVIVMLPDEVPGSRIPDTVRSDLQADSRIFVIIGTGAAGNSAAQTLREDGFKGRIIMITGENRLPYDRPQLTKEFLEGESDDTALPLRSEEFYKDRDVECMLGAKVKKVDVSGRLIEMEDGRTIQYDSLLLASGGVPRTLDVPGSNLMGIRTLRSWDDSAAIIGALAPDSRVVIVGTSFIGIESAYSLSRRGVPVTVVGLDSVPFEGVFGKEIGSLFQKLHEANGVRFKLNSQVSAFEGVERIENVVLESGERIPADLVILGVGARPATDFIDGLDLLADGSIAVDEYFQAGENVYAAGDIATFPYWYTRELARIEHWRTAEQQGRISAHNMAGKRVPYRSVPFFWTTQVGLYFRYVGFAREWDDIIFHGDVSSKVFTAYFIKDGRIRAVAGTASERDMAAIEELMRLDMLPAAEELRDETFSIPGWLERHDKAFPGVLIRRFGGREQYRYRPGV